VGLDVKIDPKFQSERSTREMGTEFPRMARSKGMHRSCQRLSGWGLFCAIGIVIAGVFCPGNVVNGCPFCDAPTTTFSEQLASAHVAVLVRWQSAHKAEQTDFAEGTTVYETLAATGPAHKDFAVGRKITVNRYIAGRSEDECLLFASRQEDQLAWGLP